eukprot:3756194-Prymnesium_polylepis.2
MAEGPRALRTVRRRAPRRVRAVCCASLRRHANCARDCAPQNTDRPTTARPREHSRAPVSRSHPAP